MELPSLFIVSEVNLDPYSGDECVVEVGKAPGEKCLRCWNFSVYVGRSSDYPDFCQRCEDVVGRMKA
jgi:isoleucyl-tRNA synthetase